MSNHPNALLAYDRATITAAVERFTGVASSVQRLNALYATHEVTLSVGVERFNALNWRATVNPAPLANALLADRLCNSPTNALGPSTTIKSL
jgi:hypothetical protein